jgi:hypothetical protein
MGCLSSKPADAATPIETSKPTASKPTASKPTDGSEKGTAASKGEKSKGTAASDEGFKEVNLSPGKSASTKASGKGGKGGAAASAGTPIAKPSKVDDGMMKELDAAVQSVKPQKGGAKEIPKPKKSGGGAGGGGGADGSAKSKSQRKNARRREKAKQKKKAEGEAGGGAPSGGKPPRVGPVVSMERDLY